MPRTNDHFLTAAAFLPPKRSLATLKAAAGRCKGCDLWQRATQTVFGEGATHARIMLVGEQPGDKEDIAGHPFVGPAGKLLEESLRAAGLDRRDVYLTNAVKHFSWTASERGKRRIHKKPRYSEIRACRPWLDAEIAIVRPQAIICLGATAAQALLGADFSVMRRRGQFIPSSLAPRVLATVHPASILRAPDAASRQAQKDAFINDLQIVVREVRGLASAA